ncbi:transcription factor SPT20 homolog [Leptidea sinapis]|uniref:transcription factor SPT20 homolog n=1 Tax=Leptidea sinapis TaxID=189913 RepID=UPI0021C34DC6|nr:transcription factor SPT20 homolog [Leptidea sinapis]
MDGLIHAALEAEVILNRAKHAHSNLSHFDGAVQEHKMIWTHEKINLSESVDDTRMKFHRSVTGSSTKANEKFDLFKKLHELYNDLSRDELSHTSYQGLKTTSYLLEKLLATYNLNTLIINLYPGNKGYSLSLKVNGNTQYLQTSDGNTSASEEETLIETPRWPYEEEELLSYIDNEELPVVLLDLLESEHSNLFYSGCIIAQVRDYRQAYPSSMCDTHHVLLRPTNQSLITDAMCIGTKCGLAGEERSALEAVEAALVNAVAPPLCLEPTPAIGLLAARLHAAPRLFNTPRIRRQAKRFSQVFVNRKRKLDQFTHYHGLELLELIHRQRAKNSRQSVPHTRLTSKFPKKPPEVFHPIEPPKMEPLPLALPSEPSGPLRLARSYERPRPTPDCQPQLVEEYVLETEKTSPHASAGFFHIKLSILQRPSDQEFLGELYVDRDHVEGERNGAACRFSLGSRLQANKYIQQFTEIFTEEGRKSVRIKHIVPGQLPRVSFTGGMRELQGQQLLVQQRTAAATTAQTHATSVPVVTTATVTGPTVHTTTRQLPILAQLQQVGTVGGVATVGTVVGNVGNVGTVVGSVGTVVGNVGTVVGNVGPNVTNLTNVSAVPSVAAVPAVAGVVETALKQQPSPTPRLSPQVHDIHSTQASTNQLLAQQLTNPPQPLNPQKMQSAIIHIQHPLMSSGGTSQVQTIQYTSTPTTQQKAAVPKPRSTNPAINALVTSLMNSAQQFQQAASQNAAKSVASTASSNATILNLLNSAPAAMTHVTSSADTSIEHKLLTRTVSIAGARLIAATTAPHTIPTYTQQVMTGYNRDTESTNVSSSESALLERLMGNEDNTGNSQPQPVQSQAQPVCHLQGVSLASLQTLQGLQSIPGLAGLQGVQNVQVQIPGLAAPISLSLNVSGAPSGLLVSVPPTTSVVLANQPSVLSLPIAQLMSAGVKGGVQVVRPARLARPTAARSASQPPGTAQFITQPQTQTLNVHQVRRKSNTDNS